MDIPSKLEYLDITKQQIKDKIESVGLNLYGIPFKNYAGYINDIANYSYFPIADVQRLTIQSINISGEEA